jgi:hypothetical protein
MRSAATRGSRSWALSCLGLFALAAALVGCGSSGRGSAGDVSVRTTAGDASVRTIASEVSVRTAAGVRFSDGITVHGARECSIETLGIIARRTKPFTQTTRSCAPSSRPAGAILIQVARPRIALVLDRPAGGCTPVRITAAGKRPIDAHVSCSATKPTLRVTVLPAGTTLSIDGIAGLTRLALHDNRCSFVCSHQIATG